MSGPFFRSAEVAYATKPNIVMIGSQAQVDAAKERAAAELDDLLEGSGGAAAPPTTVTRAGAVNTVTAGIRRIGHSAP